MFISKITHKSILFFYWKNLLGVHLLAWIVADPHHIDADPNPAFYFESGCGSGSLLPNKSSKPWKKCSNRLMFRTFWLVICKLMRIRIQLITLMRIRIRILPFNLMRIHYTVCLPPPFKWSKNNFRTLYHELPNMNTNQHQWKYSS